MLVAVLAVGLVRTNPTHTGPFRGTVVAASSKTPLVNANVTVTAGCTPVSQLTPPSGQFSVTCEASANSPNVTVWARQYATRTGSLTDGTKVELQPRPIPGFPAENWQFEGWVVQAQTGDVPGTNISFLAHPSAYRTPSGRVFVTSTANRHAGPGWTNAYWQDENNTIATAMPYPLINQSNSAIPGTAFTGRMVFAEGRLFMLVGMGKPTLLENKNLDDPSNPTDWVPAEGNGSVNIDFTDAPTSRHEDARFHVFEDDLAFTCKGIPRKYWLFVIPDGVPGVAGRACGRLGFASASLTGPYTYCNWIINPQGSGDPGSPTSNCASWPGDVIRAPDALYFVAGWGNLYRMPLNGSSVLHFDRLVGDGVITTPAPQGSYDDFRQIEFTFLPPAAPGERTRLYHASYSSENSNPNATRADYGFKQALGMYTFDWPSAESTRLP